MHLPRERASKHTDKCSRLEAPFQFEPTTFLFRIDRVNIFFWGGGEGGEIFTLSSQMVLNMCQWILCCQLHIFIRTIFLCLTLLIYPTYVKICLHKFNHALKFVVECLTNKLVHSYREIYMAPSFFTLHVKHSISRVHVRSYVSERHEINGSYICTVREAGCDLH